MIKHKAEEKGVNVICHEESYTSGCSFPDNESTVHHETTKEQEHQEEYSQHHGISNVNGALNILKKEKNDIQCKQH